MRHRVQGRKLGLPSDQRKALLKGLVMQLFAHNFIVTTETRAKEVRRIAERLITLAGEDTLSHRRHSRKWLSTQTPYYRVPKPGNYNSLSPIRRAQATARIVGRKKEQTSTSTAHFVAQLFEEIAPTFRDRPGGYTRIYKLGFRRGDAAPMVRLELVKEE